MGTRPFLRTKVSRLLLPWLLWSVIYLAMVFLERLRHGEPLTKGFSLWMLVGGTYHHLWFVPFALAGALLMAAVQPATRALSHGAVIGGALLTGAALALLNAQLLAPGTIEWPVLQWLFALPALPLGFALGRTMLAADRASSLRVAWLSVAVGLTCLGLGLGQEMGLLGWGVPELVRRYAVSMALVGLACVWPGVPDPVSQRLTPLLLGVYLVHPLIVRVYLSLHLPVLPTAVFAALVFSASALLVAALQRSRLRLLV
jgi:fucose 4-O-acetylase-like acetyltransferase